MNFNSLSRVYKKTPYYWKDRKKARRDFNYIQLFSLKILKLISKELNKVHGTCYSTKAWNLMVGYWLILFLTVSFDRYKFLKNSNAQHRHSQKSKTHKIVLPINSADAEGFFSNSDDWNEQFMVHMIKIIKSNSYNLDCHFSYTPFQENTANKLFSKAYLKKKVRILIENFISKLMKNLQFGGSSYVLVTHALSIGRLLKLRVFLDGVMHIYNSTFPTIRSNLCKTLIRDWKIPVHKNDTEFEKLVKYLIPQYMPVNFLEAFKEIETGLRHHVSLPEKPNVIFSANAHFSNDFFKIWTAIKVDEGCKVVFGQHGSGPFHEYNGGHSYEANSADFFVTTGTGNNCYKHGREVGQFFSKLKYSNWNPRGPALLITVLMPKYIFDLRSMALADDMQSYFDDQFSFYEILPEKIKDKLVVRMYCSNEKNDYDWDIVSSWTKKFPKVRLQYSNKAFKKAAGQSRICVSTYNGTTYNETLAANIPTLIFWNTNIWKWKKDADTDFEKMKEVGIFHDNPHSAATHLRKVWDNVGEWWYSTEVQKARSNFCLKYANIEPGIERRMAAVLKEAAKSS